jgi:hypothetical protein
MEPTLRVKKPAMVLLWSLCTGASDPRRTFRGRFRFLRAGTDFIAYSRRFHPPNEIDPSDRTYAAERHAENLAALLGALDAGKAHLVGSSYGAYIILVLALPATFDALAWTHKKEYVEWILAAKRDETLAKRVNGTIEWLRKGPKIPSDKGQR